MLSARLPFLFDALCVQTDAPNVELIDQKEILGPTVILLTCSYMEQEFIRIGYYVNNEYETPEMNENPPDQVDIARVVRNILADSPRVTRFDIKWTPETERMAEMPDAASGAEAEAAAAAVADASYGGNGGQMEMEAAPMDTMMTGAEVMTA